MNTMDILPIEIRHKLPKIQATEEQEDPIVVCKFFFPDFSWTWYAIEFDGDDLFFGYVAGDYPELGYFTLSELQNNVGKFGCSIERDVNFEPTKLSDLRKLHE